MHFDQIYILREFVKILFVYLYYLSVLEGVKLKKIPQLKSDNLNISGKNLGTGKKQTQTHLFQANSVISHQNLYNLVQLIMSQLFMMIKLRF